MEPWPRRRRRSPTRLECRPCGVAAADFNADGNLDLAIANEISGQSPVALGYGNGAFNTAGVLYSGGFSVGTAVGDFNADGKMDLIVVSSGVHENPSQISAVTVSLGNGDGTFTLGSGSPIPVGNSLSAIVISDFNGDGKLDVAVTDSGGNAVLILLGNGDGTFAVPTTIPVGNQPDAIVAGDFNDDGKLDLAVANYGDGTITLLLGNGNGTFTQASGSPYAVGARAVPDRGGGFQRRWKARSRRRERDGWNGIDPAAAVVPVRVGRLLSALLTLRGD